jgi:hypothetical protein
MPEAEVTPKTSFKNLVGDFLEGKNASHEKFHSLENTLFNDRTIIARRCNDGTIILAENGVLPTELNDQLIGQMFAKSQKYNRVDDFCSLTDPMKRVADLKNGNFDQFETIANLFQFPFEARDIAAITRAKEFTARVSDFFSKLQKEEQDRIRTAEEKERAERVAREAISWDTGVGSTSNPHVEGAGGGQRLRLKKKTKSDRYEMVETSTGHALTLNQAKKTWDFASKFWHGGKLLSSYGASRTISSSSGYYGRSSSRSAEVHHDRVHFGCQRVTRKEAERFADAMGWERAKKTK